MLKRGVTLRFAFTTNVAKSEILQSLAPPTLDLDAIPKRQYDEVIRLVETQSRVLEGTPEDARGFRFRTIGGHTHFAASRVMPLPFDDFVERVDISASIRYMNDYLGGDWFIAYYGDIGGFSVSSDLTWQAYAAVGYGFHWGSLQIGYRHLDYIHSCARCIENEVRNVELVLTKIESSESDCLHRAVDR